MEDVTEEELFKCWCHKGQGGIFPFYIFTNFSDYKSRILLKNIWHVYRAYIYESVQFGVNQNKNPDVADFNGASKEAC